MLICLVMLIPIIPFFFFADTISAWVESISEDKSPSGILILGAIIFLLLASDIFLPVPSSAVNTIAGLLGIFWGTVICFLGLTVGAILGFWISRKWGHQIAKKFSSENEIARMQIITDRFGPVTLAIVRGVPVLAEASVILFGMHQLPWKKFLPPILFSNFVLAFAYTWFGTVAAEMELFPLGLAVAIGLPILLLMAFKKFVEQKEQSSVKADNAHESDSGSQNS